MSPGLVERFKGGDRRALARALSLVEAGHPEGEALLKALKSERRAKVVGLTGSPGAGKSSLADRLIAEIRRRGETVAVLATDPTSPFTGGAVLGDRIRMMRHHQDPGVYVRSMASRGVLGGLARASGAALSLLEAFGFDWVILETVGVGQSEVDVARLADTTVLVLTPAAGDAVQAFKAGVMEIADVIAVNKFDLPGGERLVEEIKGVLELSPTPFPPPIVPTVAATGEGVPELLEAIEDHRRYLLESGGLEKKRLERARFEVQAEIQAASQALAEGAGELLAAVARGDKTPREAARELIRDSQRR